MDPKLDSCTGVHQKEYGRSPSVIASAPGKVSLLGDFTEFAKGVSLSAALVCRLYVSISPRDDTIVRFFSREYNERKKSVVSNLKFRKEDRWANYPKGVISIFSQMGVNVQGLDLSVCGDIPQSIGLGSSQALCLATAYALDALLNTHFTPAQLIQIVHRAESTFLGHPSSDSALFIQTYAQNDRLFWLDSRTYEGESMEFPWPDLEFAVVNSRVPSSSFDSSSKKAREECELCLKYLTSGRSGKTLRDFTKLDLREHVGTIPESARRRSLHVIEEILRSQEAKEAFQEKDVAVLGRLMNRSHESLRDLYEVSCPEIDWLVKRLQEIEGVVGARMSGEESGGCVVAVAKSDAWKKFKAQCEEYERIFGFKVDILVFRPASGVQVHTASSLA